MEFIKRIFYIYCKECNNDIVEVPNCSGLCKQCNINTEKLQKPNNNLELLTKFMSECSNERKNELLTILLLKNNIIPKELKDSYSI